MAELTPEDHRRIVDECYYCKLCFNHCPYTPPHQYEIDFPHLMILRKQRLAAERGVRWRDRWLIATDVIGRLGSLTAGPLNWLMTRSAVRRLVEAVAGVHRDRHILQFSAETFPRWFSRRPRPVRRDVPVKKVALFSSCLVNYQATDVGKADCPSTGEERRRGRRPGAAVLRHALLRYRGYSPPSDRRSAPTSPRSTSGFLKGMMSSCLPPVAA